MVGSHDILVIDLGQWLDGGQMTSTLTKNEPKKNLQIYRLNENQNYKKYRHTQQ